MNFFSDWYKKVVANWHEALQDARFRRYFPINFVACFIVYNSAMYWVSLHSTRPGMMIRDPFYPLLPRYDFSRIIFIFTYTATLLIIYDMVRYPYLLQRALVSFAAVFFIRAICIHMVPLSPSPDIIPLQDPVTDWLGGEGHILNDLFFSGHVADLTTFYLLCRSVAIRRYIFGCLCIIALLLVSQRVHYTVDVVLAPLFSYLCYWLFVQRDIIWGPFLGKLPAEYSRGHTLAD